jgi:tetraacyldisaccharide 4'-kinase
MGVHLLDDGFQHRQLFRDVDVVLVNSEDLADWLLPAGNLREPLSALRRATVFAVPVGDDGAVQRLRQMGLDQPVWRFGREMAVPKGLAGEPVIAFCGIARPEQFFEGLTGADVQVVERCEFADHHRFSRRDLERLKRAAVTSGAKALVTTEKDWVRLGVLGVELENLVAVGLRAVLEDEGGVTSFFRDRIGGLRG